MDAVTSADFWVSLVVSPLWFVARAKERCKQRGITLILMPRRHGGEKEGIGSSKKRLWRVGCILSYVLMRNLHTGILELLLFSLWAEGGLMYRRLGARRELGAAAEVAVAAERPKEVLVQTPPVSGRSLHRAGSSVKKRRF